MRPTYLKLFNIELMIETASGFTLSYLKESATERELQLGKIRILISSVKATASKLVFERY